MKEHVFQTTSVIVRSVQRTHYQISMGADAPVAPAPVSPLLSNADFEASYGKRIKGELNIKVQFKSPLFVNQVSRDSIPKVPSRQYKGILNTRGRLGRLKRRFCIKNTLNKEFE